VQIAQNKGAFYAKVGHGRTPGALDFGMGEPTFIRIHQGVAKLLKKSFQKSVDTFAVVCCTSVVLSKTA
jgi:hypothetical protein